MYPFLLKHICCPVDKGSLEIVVFEQQRVILTEEQNNFIRNNGHTFSDFEINILSGLLLNRRKKIFYPIFAGVPRLLTFKHSLLDKFNNQFLSELVKFTQNGYSYVQDEEIPGEKNILASFSNEWTDYGYSEEVYWGQSTNVYNESLFSTINHENQNLKHKLVLEVGIGSGGSANFMSNKFNCNLIGVDLGYSVDVANKNFAKNPFLHIVQASVFNLPFANETFDFVYSHGVIHHTFNTQKAFNALAKLPKSGGRLYIWVYSVLNEQRTLKRRIIMLMERLIRPWCSMLPGWLQTVVLVPIAPLYIFHQNTINIDSKTGMAKYRWREAMHAARDRFTPKYIHRHSETEVIKWFLELGYKDVRPLSIKKLPDFVPVGFYMNTGVEGFKQ
ncbi:MAG: class I SAM-dependent methyltransferase [Cyclobacteriaceae bacterium]|nr:class I SAM-dependent methyltransferase [Cyclobacteriaceae bacterium]